MDILNECEFSILTLDVRQLVSFNDLAYWGYTYKQALAGMGHISFDLCLN